jgi:hypothetical protein
MGKSRKQPLSAFIILAFFIFFQPFSSQSQEISSNRKEKKNLIEHNLLPLPFKSFNLFYERKLNDQSSFALGANYYHNNQLLIFQRFDSRWYGLTAEYKYYLGSVFNGFYLSPYLKYRLMNYFDVVNYLEDDNGLAFIATPPQDETWHDIGLGGTFGYKYLSKRGFAFGAFLGGGYFPISILQTINPDFSIRRPSQGDLRIGATIGWAF